jgi:hypothetical protein
MPSWRRADRWGTAVPKPRVTPLERLPSRRWSRRAVRRRAHRVGALSVLVASADRSVDGVEALKGPQHPPGRTPGHEQRVQRGLGRPRSAAAHGVRRGW